MAIKKMNLTTYGLLHSRSSRGRRAKEWRLLSSAPSPPPVPSLIEPFRAGADRSADRASHWKAAHGQTRQEER